MFLNIDGYDAAVTVLRSYISWPDDLRAPGWTVAVHDVYGERTVARGRVRIWTELHELRTFNAAIRLTPGYEPQLKTTVRRLSDVEMLANLLEFDSVNKQWGYYSKVSRRWHFNFKSIAQCMLDEGRAWVDWRKVRDAIGLRKHGERYFEDERKRSLKRFPAPEAQAMLKGRA